MRKKIIAGNWKMNLDVNEAIDLAMQIEDHPGYSKIKNCELILAPPYPYLDIIKSVTDDSPNIYLAGQNCHSELKGAFTGEVSASMLHSIGADYVIIGHSERRNYNKESLEEIKSKVDIALNNELQVIFCCGETFLEKEKGLKETVVQDQISSGLFHLNENKFKQIIIAYEPVWAIGTGQNASAHEAQEMHSFIRNLISNKYSKDISKITSILYGGSCNPDNASDLFEQPDVDGGLIGGASLVSNDFMQIVLALEKINEG